MTAVAVKAIRPEAARNPAGFLRDRVQLVPEDAENEIAEVSPVERVDGMKLLDIQHDGVHRHVGVFTIDAIGVLEEIVAVVQAAQAVDLRQGNKLLCPLLRPHAPQQQEDDHQYHNADAGHDAGQIVPYKIAQAELCVLCNIIGKRRVEGGGRDQADHP